MPPVDKPCLKRHRGENAKFRPRKSYSILYLANCRREASGDIFSMHPSLIQPYAVSFLLMWPFLSVQMVEKQQKTQTRIRLSPLVKALLPDLFAWLAVQYPWSRQFGCRGFSCKAASKLREVLRGQCKAALFPHGLEREDMSKRTVTFIPRSEGTPWPYSFIFCNVP